MEHVDGVNLASWLEQHPQDALLDALRASLALARIEGDPHRLVVVEKTARERGYLGIARLAAARDTPR